MTRINCGIPVENLHNKHLLAEHREIIRIPNCIKKGRYQMIGIPMNFTLGKGHVKFFYDKLKYLHDRYNQLYLECIKRGFNVQNYNDSFIDVPQKLYNDYLPSESDKKIIQGRLDDKLKNKLIFK